MTNIRVYTISRPLLPIISTSGCLGILGKTFRMSLQTWSIRCFSVFTVISILLILFDCLKNLIYHLRHYGIAIGLYAFVSPFWKGNSVQSEGKPIISPTNRGLSWEFFPIHSSELLAIVLVKFCCL